jgi:hypothetical protein
MSENPGVPPRVPLQIFAVDFHYPEALRLLARACSLRDDPVIARIFMSTLRLFAATRARRLTLAINRDLGNIDYRRKEKFVA